MFMQASQIIIAIVVGLVVALIVTGIMRSNLKSVQKQQSAVYYEKEEGLTLTKNKDIYMYKKVDRTPKPKDENKQKT
jgi:uncharacterized protein